MKRIDFGRLIKMDLMEVIMSTRDVSYLYLAGLVSMCVWITNILWSISSPEHCSIGHCKFRITFSLHLVHQSQELKLNWNTLRRNANYYRDSCFT